MRITHLTFLAFFLNAAIDTGKYNDISLQEVANRIEKGTIFEFLQTHLGDDIDLSTFEKERQQQLTSEWQDMLQAMSPRRKFAVENNGLCLLIAYLLEGIQRRQDNNPRD
jgi:hypothetical protein